MCVQFDDGKWHSLDSARRAIVDKNFKKDKFFEEEVTPFVYLSEYEALPRDALFRKPMINQRVDADIEYQSCGGLRRIQITRAFAKWPPLAGDQLSGGYQDHLLKEKLRMDGELFGYGPFRRNSKGSAREIESFEGVKAWDDIRSALRQGLVHAFAGKTSHDGSGVVLIVHAVRYHETICDPLRFRSLVYWAARQCIAKNTFPRSFSNVVVIDRGPEFSYSLPEFLWSSAEARL